jgi:hypothetical protein
MGQRLHPMAQQNPKDERGCVVAGNNQKHDRGKPEIPSVQSGYREERDWLAISRHLNTLAEYIVVNVGGLHMEMSSPSMKYASVGGPIVVGGRKSRLQGEGGQGIDIRWTK